MKKVIISGAAGFLGYSTTKEFLENDYEVYAILRPGSVHNTRLDDLVGPLHRIELLCDDYDQFPDLISDKCNLFIHLVSFGDREDFAMQKKNMEYCIKALECASVIGCGRYICIGSQAEIGITDDVIDENTNLNPVSGYGACKASAMYLTRYYAKQLGIDWIWARIFSLYGKYATSNRLLPDLIDALTNNKDISLSSCEQFWDYLNVKDAARALLFLAEKGHDGEVYNVASGENRSLMDYVESAKKLFDYKGNIYYGPRTEPFVSLKPSIDKIKAHTGWEPIIDFDKGVLELAYEKN